MPRETVLESRDGFVLTLTLNRPAQKNAFNAVMWGELGDALREAKEDPEVRCVVLTGSGGAFSAGQDLGEMGGSTEPAEGTPVNPFAPFMDELCAFDKPLVAAVNGVGVGIGLTILLHCEFVYIAEGVRLRAPFVQLGVVPEAASSYLLARVVGDRNAAEILFTANWVSAESAVEMGLAHELCAPEDVLATAQAKAAQVAVNGPASLRHTKRLLLESRRAEVEAARSREDAAFLVRVGSAENIEAIRAFFEKRTPDFTGLSQD